MKKIILFLIIIAIVAYILPSLLNMAFTIGVLVILSIFGYLLYKAIRLYDKINKDKKGVQ